MRLSNILEIARFTLHEAISRRLILAGILISAGYLGLYTLGFHFAYDKALENSPTPQSRLALGVAFAVLTLFGVYVVNYLASFLALFLSVGAISGEIDSGTLHAVLARPLRRSEFVLGRWLGYAVLTGAYVVVMTTSVTLIARLMAGYEVPDLLPALGLMLLETLLLLTLSLCGSTLMPTLANGVIAFSLIGLAWLAGIIEYVGQLLATAPDSTASDAMVNIGTAVALLIPSDALWRGASFYLEPPTLLAAMGAGRPGIPFFAIAPPASMLIVWSVGYVGVVLIAAVVAFSRRDL
jgi:ABC-type transport system involved in multi-copper enzyme maturation permease subunit